MTRCDWLLLLDAHADLFAALLLLDTHDDLFACWRPVEAVLDVLSL